MLKKTNLVLDIDFFFNRSQGREEYRSLPNAVFEFERLDRDFDKKGLLQTYLFLTLLGLSQLALMGYELYYRYQMAKYNEIKD